MELVINGYTIISFVVMNTVYLVLPVYALINHIKERKANKEANKEVK